MREEVVLAGEARHEGQPRIGEVEVHALSYRRPQEWISAFVEHSAVVNNHRAQHVVGRAGDALAIAELCAPLSLAPSHRQVGEPVVVGPAGLCLPGAERGVIGRHVLKAQPAVQLPLSPLQLIVGKGGNVFFLHLVVNVGNDVFLVDVDAVALRGRGLRASAEHAFPHGIGEHQLAGSHAAVFTIERGDGAVAQFAAELLLVELVLAFAPQHGGIQVDAQLPHLSYIVSVQFPHGPVGRADVCFQEDVAIEFPVLLVSLTHVGLEAVVKNFLRREGQAQGMVGVEVVVHSGVVLQLCPAAPDGQVNACEELVFPDLQLLLHVLFHAVVAIVEGHGGEGLQAAGAVFEGQVVVGVPLVVLPRLAGGHQAEAVALRLQRLDANDGVHLGIVFRPRRGDDVHVLDVHRLELPELVGVAHLLVVDVDFGLALGHYGELAVLALHQGEHGKQVVGGAHVAEDAVLHINGHAAGGHLVLRYFALHGNSLHGIGLGVQGDGADVPCADQPRHGLIAYEADFHDDALLLAWYDEVAVLVAHAAVDVCGICGARR